jgi:nucleotide-binding universal stress UspA family protein
MKIESILFPTDFSDRCAAALEYASDLAATFGATLHITYIDNVADLVARSAYPFPSFISHADRSEMQAELLRVVPTVADVKCVHHYLEGEPSVGICAIAERERVDLIVMSSHGRSGISRLVMGSVTESVLRRATCPVLVVRPSSIERTNTAMDTPACSHA